MSDWKARAIARRDYKHDLAEPKLINHSKKDTKRWCRGKVGILHDFDFVKLWGFFGWTSIFNHNAYADYICLNCGKKEYVELQAQEI